MVINTKAKCISVWGICLSAVLFSCNHSDKNDLLQTEVTANSKIIIQKFFYPDGSLKVERTCLVKDRDTIIHGNEKDFYPNGQLQREVSFEKGKKQGTEKGYYENGVLEHVGNYKADKQDSLWIWYYNETVQDKKSVQAIDFWSNGNPLSHQTKYLPNESIKEYLFYDPIGRPIYKREFTSVNKFYEEGSRYPQIVMVNQTKNLFIKGEHLVARIYHIIPPQTKTALYVRIKGLQSNWEEVEHSSYYAPINFNMQLNRAGKFLFEVKLVLKDLQNSDSSEYVSNVEFEVR